MEEYFVRILDIERLTHDVRRYKVEKPEGYSFIPGQATEVAIDKDGWRDERRPFTFTALNEWEFLEFTIKSYRDHDGVTNQLGKLARDARLILHDVWGSIHYEKPGLFIAGGAGVTPFIAIFRMLAHTKQIPGNRLLFANKSRNDIIMEQEFKHILGNNFINILSDEEVDGYHHGYVDEKLLEKYLDVENDHVYLCGPPPMMDAVQNSLTKLGFSGDKMIVEL